MTRLDPFTLPLSGTRLIEASAGTGKTHTIANLYVRLLLDAGLEVGRILVVTYTNAATAELRGRIRERVARVAVAVGSGTRADPTDEELNEWVLLRHRGESRRLDEQRLLAALHNFDDAAIFTIHGFCQRALQENAFESGTPFDIELISDQTLLLDRVVRDFLVCRLAAAPRELVQAAQNDASLATLMELARKATLHRRVPVLPDPPPADDAGTALRREFVDYARRESQRHKNEANVQFFDDLLHRFLRSLEGAGGERLAERVAERFRAALIDEFQDTDRVQYDIFRHVFAGRRPLFLIGDPKQAIYAFRGADVFTYFAAREEARQATDRAEHHLDVNWRSDPGLLRAVNTLFGRTRRSFLFDRIAYVPAVPRHGAGDRLDGPRRAPFQFLFCDTGSAAAPAKKDAQQRVARDVAADIACFLDEGHRIAGRGVQPSDIAVLCRTNDQAALVQDELRRLAVPAVLQGDRSVLDTPEAQAVERVLAAMADPARADAVRAALATPLFGFDAEALLNLASDEAGWDRQVERLQTWRDTWLARGFTPAFRQMLDEGGVVPRLLALPDGERQLTNVLHLGELLQAAAAETRRRPLALVEWLSLMRRDENLRRDALGEAAQIRLESDEDALVLTTIHRSKGLQYRIVYCPFLWWDFGTPEKEAALLFHDPRHGDRLTLDVGASKRDEHLAQARRETLAENLRLLYVAVTRAQHRCTVVWGKFKGVEHAALAYLLHQPADPSDDLATAVVEHVTRLTPAQMREDLERIAAAAAGAIAVDDLREHASPPVWQRRTPAAPLEPARTLGGRTLDVKLRTSSYSDLTRATHPAVAEAAVDDEESALDEVDRADPPELSDRSDARSVKLADFPRGTGPGTLIHHVFEHLDFCNEDPAHLRGLIDTAASRAGLAIRHRETLAGAIRDVLHTPLGRPEAPIRLAEVPRGERLNEMPFLLAVAAPDAGDAPGAGPIPPAGENGLTAERLAACFARHGAADYAERLRELSFAPVRGFLNGVIDLVFRHRTADNPRGRWYLADYKSTFLGIHPDDYRPERLREPMEDEHYLLQYHLYVVALHRYLESRLDGYDYDRDFGGVFYLFVRGMSPDYAPGNGVFADRPARALIEELAGLFTAPSTPRT